MKQLWMGVGGVVLLSTMFFACPPDGPNNNGDDAGTTDGDTVPIDPIIKVSGTAEMHPNAVAYLQSISADVPTVEGLTLRVEEPLQVALGDETNGVFGTVTLPASGEFSVEEVDTQYVGVGIAAGIRDERDAGTPSVVRSATTIYDVILEEQDPDTDIAGARAYALPAQFVEKLNTAVGATAISTISGDAELDTLLEVGFILGKIVDAQGNPVAGAKVEPSSFASNFFYPSEDYASTSQLGTSANGLFIFVWNGKTPPDLFEFTIQNKPEYRKRRAGAAPNAGVVMTVYPGTTPPP